MSLSQYVYLITQKKLRLLQLGNLAVGDTIH